jgi:hypothetical protein
VSECLLTIVLSSLLPVKPPVSLKKSLWARYAGPAHPGASTGRYISTGHLLYSKADHLIVAPFDHASLGVTGPPVTLAERARCGVGEGAQDTVSETGTDGGTEPRWPKDGRELFYRAGDKMMAVTITPEAPLTAGSPRILFEGRYQVTDTGSGGYDVSADGRFLMIQATVAEQPATEFNIVLGWFDV